MALKSVIFTLLFALSIHVLADGSSRQRSAVGKFSKEVVMTFQGTVEVSGAAPTYPGLLREQVEKQLRFLFGWMTEGPAPGAPKGDHRLTEMKMARKSDGTLVVAYTYAGTVIVRRDQGTWYDVLLPVNPDTIYSSGLVGQRNLCGDPEFPAVGDYWFAWEPRRRGCPLREGRDYKVFRARLSAVARPKTTYPEYGRLADAQGNIRIDFLMGKDDGEHQRDPNRSRDENANNFRKIRNALVTAGWQSEVWSDQRIRAVIGPAVSSDRLPYVESLSKIVRQAGTGQEYRLFVRFFYGRTEAEADSTPFHWYLKDALENAAVVVYDGHSGIGSYLDLPEIERRGGFRFLPPKDRYQIYYFNSCNSYTHYNTMFFGRKMSPRDPGGTKNLDIITAGLSTYFDRGFESNLAFIAAIEAWAGGRARLSYQQLTPRMDTGNLLAVNGDDDNPRR